MRIFIERFVLAILAPLAVLLVVTNPMGFSWPMRIIGVTVIVVVAGIAAHIAGWEEWRWERLHGMWWLWVIFGLSGGVALALWLIPLLGPPPGESRATKATVTYLNGIELLPPYSQLDKPLSFRGTVAITVTKLRVFIDYSLYQEKWQPVRRVAIGEFKEPFRNQQVEMQIVYKARRAGINDPRLDLWIGDPSSVSDASWLPPANTDGGGIPPIERARLAIIGPSGEEQHYYFTLLRTMPLPGVNWSLFVFPETEHSWVSDWELR
jgi:hypothetical protein